MKRHTIEELAAVLAYDPQTGVLTWTRDRGHARAGAEAGGVNKRSGYRAFRLDRTSYLSHRVAWAIHHGEWPVMVDHINRCRTDNRLSNLRDARSALLNGHNSSDRPRTIRPFRGVAPNGLGWAARMQVFSKAFHIGQYETPALANEAWRLAYAEREVIYINHPNLTHAEAIARLREAAGSPTLPRNRKQAVA